MNPRLLELLVKENLLSSDQAAKAAAEQRRTNERLGTILKRLGYLSDDDLLDFLSRKYGIPVINLQRVEVTEEIVRLVKKEIVSKYQVFPVRKVGNTLTLALSDPTVVLAIDDVQFATGLHVIPVLASESAIKEAIDKHYVDSAAKLDEILQKEQQIGADALELVDKSAQKVDITELGEEAGEAPVIRFVNLILADAIRKRASDIHLEPYEKVFRVRYRIDGVLHDVMAPPKAMEAAILSRVKIMANMDIAERRLPQDGRIRATVRGKDIDLRVSTMPTLHGESVVLRILDRSSTRHDFAALGFNGQALAGLKQALAEPNGIVLVTGPTGSGKTTTLYTALASLDSASQKIFTVEDPVEYELAGINQIQVQPQIGLNFASALRSILRQDPDIIMIGEIRDLETAEIAIRASLTGHLVFSTLHTNDAPSAFTRLIDMGIEPFLVASSVEAVMAQRLVRTICPVCKTEQKVERDYLRKIGFPEAEIATAKFYRGAGCEECRQLGYQGRMGIYELLILNEAIRPLILNRAPATTIAQRAMEQGMRTLRTDGWNKVRAAQTTIEEVLRVTQTEEHLGLTGDVKAELV